jgi:hypothetical protein
LPPPPPTPCSYNKKKNEGGLILGKTLFQTKRTQRPRTEKSREES